MLRGEIFVDIIQPVDKRVQLSIHSRNIYILGR